MNSLENDYKDLHELRERSKNLSVWRLKNGMQEMVESLVQKLKSEQNVRLHLNEPIESLNFDNEKSGKSIQIKSKSITEDVDLVISSIYSKCQ